MTPEELLQALDEEGDPEQLGIDWEKSEGDGKTPAFLTQNQIIESLDWCGLEKSLAGPLIEMARLITRTPPLLRLARHCVWVVFENPESRELHGHPRLESCLGDRAGHYYLLVCLAIVPFMREHHLRMNIPESTTRETCRQVHEYIDTYTASHDGKAGVPARRINWLRHYVREPYFRVGRLEYWLKPNPAPCHAYRHRRSGQMVVLMWDEQKVAQEGYPVRDDYDGGYWISEFSENDTAANGYPISPDGSVVRKPVTLSFDEWEKVLKPGTQVLQIHIPAGESVTPESLLESKKEAIGFFAKHFPDAEPVAFETTSWMFSPLLEELLPPESNLVRYLSEVYVFPIESSPYGGLSFIFPEDDFDPATATRATSLQGAILDHIASGKPWRIGGMYMLLDDLKHYGSQHYRSTWKLSEFGQTKSM